MVETGNRVSFRLQLHEALQRRRSHELVEPPREGNKMVTVQQQSVRHLLEYGEQGSYW